VQLKAMANTNIDAAPVGFWVRAGAYIIDILVIGLLLIANVFLGIKAAIPWQYGFIFIGIFISFLYHFLMIGIWGQTIGKMVAGAVVVRDDLNKAGYLKALIRYFGQYLSYLSCDVGYFLAIFNHRRKTLHDYIAGTRVIYKSNIGPVRKGFMVFIACIFFSFSSYVIWFVYKQKLPWLSKKLLSERLISSNVFERIAARDELSKLDKSQTEQTVSDMMRQVGTGAKGNERFATETLAAIGPNATQAVPALISALKSQDFLTRCDAADALAKIGPQGAEAIPALIEALKDDRPIAYSAAQALANMGPQAIPVLNKTVDDYDNSMRRGAIESLGLMGAQAVPSLIHALAQQDSYIRKLAAENLEKIDTPDAREALKTYWTGNRPEDPLSKLEEKSTKQIGPQNKLAKSSNKVMRHRHRRSTSTNQ